MPFYEIDFTYDVEEYGSVIIEAEDSDDAALQGLSYVKETYPDVKNIVIDDVEEVVR